VPKNGLLKFSSTIPIVVSPVAVPDPPTAADVVLDEFVASLDEPQAASVSRQVAARAAPPHR
jgi:hypothetical protein